MKRATSDKERLNLYLPKDVLDRLRRHVPARERNRFICELVAREVRRLELKAAIEASAGAWGDKDHPELATPADIDKWIEEGRSAMEWDRALGDGR